MKTQVLRRNGFTLPELVVGAATLALLAAVGLPALSQNKAPSPSATCIANLQRIGQAMRMYSRDYDESLLPCNLGDKRNAWFFLLKPYLSKQQPYDAKSTWFLCPEDKTPYADNGYAPGCRFSYGYNNTAGDSCDWVRSADPRWRTTPRFRLKKMSEVPPETALVTEVKPKNDWMEWFLSDAPARPSMLFPHEDEDGPFANILFVEGNVLPYSKYAMEDVWQWRLPGAKGANP